MHVGVCRPKFDDGSLLQSLVTLSIEAGYLTEPGTASLVSHLLWGFPVSALLPPTLGLYWGFPIYPASR